MAFLKVVLQFDTKSIDANNREELIQRAAWRLVRSAADRIKGPHRGNERLLWAIDQLRKEFKGADNQMLYNAEDYIRAAYMHFSTETSTPGVGV